MQRLAVGKQSFFPQVKRELPELIDKAFILNRFHRVKKKSDDRDNCPTTFNPVGIVFNSNRDRDREIYLMNTDGTNQVNLTNNPTFDIDPWFSPDGSKIAFTSHPDDNRGEIYVMNADGSNQTRLTNHPAFDFQPSFSPNGSRIAFYSERDGNFEIYVMNADGTSQTRLTSNTASEFSPSFSPDGNKIRFVSDRDGDNDIYEIDLMLNKTAVRTIL